MITIQLSIGDGQPMAVDVTPEALRMPPDELWKRIYYPLHLAAMTAPTKASDNGAGA